MRSLGSLALALIISALATQGVAGAEFMPGADILSVSPERSEQADARTTQLDISQDGRYVALNTQARNLFPAGYADPPGQFRQGGVFRKDTVTRSLDLVAFGDLRATAGEGLVRRGAQNPSISADGRYVSFSSADQLVPEDMNTQIDVYVRDMDQPIDSPGAFELASARDGSAQPATYGGPPGAVTGAEITPEGALSSDGRRVVFGTRAQSDLPAAEFATVPAGQLFVRDMDAHTTTLVTRNKTDGTPAGGASSVGTLATISANGSTVAWTGQSAALLTRLQPGEIESAVYYLWQRVADGPGAPTRRITGAADVDDPGCAESDPWTNDETARGPCYGPLGNPEDSPIGSLSGVVPSLSADGYRVAFLVNSPLRGTPAGNQLDVFVAQMDPGLTRKAATTELTRESSVGVTGSIKPLVISADGNSIAFVSNRSDFAVNTPRLVTPPPATENAELYVVHLDRMEIERVTMAWNGDETDRDVGTSVGSVSISADGHKLAFTSQASNLLPGDANEVADAFLASDGNGGGEGARALEAPFPDFTPREDADEPSAPVLPLSVRRGPGRGVRVTVTVPQAGSVTLTARARVRSGKRSKLRPIAEARKRVRAAARVTLALEPERRFRRYVRRERRLRSRLEVRFTPSGGGHPIVARRTVSFTS